VDQERRARDGLAMRDGGDGSCGTERTWADVVGYVKVLIWIANGFPVMGTITFHSMHRAALEGPKWITAGC
jgi:hypothetical protein